MQDKNFQTFIQKRHWSTYKGSRRKPYHPVVLAAFEPLANICESLVNSPSQHSVLDVGCGNGFLQYVLENLFGNVVGLDYSMQMLMNNPCKYKCLGSAIELPFPNDSFDIVTGSHILHHLVEPQRILALKEMKRVARHSVVSFEPNRNNPLMFLFSAINKEEQMALQFSTSYMKNLFMKAGFESLNVHVQGWIVPNKAPKCWIKVGNLLRLTALNRIGFDICSIGPAS